MDFKLKCMACGAEYSPQEIRYTCDCGGLLDVEHDLDSLREQVSRELFDDRVRRPELDFGELSRAVEGPSGREVRRRPGVTSKLLEAVKHPSIQVFTQAEVTQLQGERGDLRVEVQQYPRYVDMAKCTACGECVPVCPVTVQLDAERAIYKPDNAVPSIFAIEKRGPAPCKVACPAGIHVQGYVALIAQGKFAEALALIREAIPFPGICGRVCHHPCEDACRRAEHDEPIAIEYLKRFVADWE
ncbi:MAG: 4Fe-4S binding protein, partial [Anaerolineae bacterium]|nr:4Fe-4S binding protein [Anaerolineae bacterium]